MTSRADSLVAHLIGSIERAERLDSKLFANPPKFFPEGMSGKKNRCLLNNVCEMPGTRYLEVGLWQGSTFCSALYGNPIRAVGIDDWSEYGGPKERFMTLVPYFADKGSRVSIVDGDCFRFFTEERFNIFFFDGGHSVLDHYRAISHFGWMMDREFILLVDDFRSPEVHEGTELAINDLNYEIVHQTVLGNVGRNEDGENWWNGVLAAVVRRPE